MAGASPGLFSPRLDRFLVFYNIVVMVFGSMAMVNLDAVIITETTTKMTTVIITMEIRTPLLPKLVSS